MKVILTILILSLCIIARAQQIETFETGTYSELFHTNPAAVFSLVNGQGIGATRAIQPGNVMYNINYLKRGSYDLSFANATLEFSAFFKVVRPTSTNLGVDTIQLGFAQNQNTTSFLAAGQTGIVSYRIEPKATNDTGSGFRFQGMIYVSVGNGTTSAGFGWGTIAKPLLRSNNWYKATLSIQRINSSSLNIVGRIDDYGTTGQSYAGMVDYTEANPASGDATFPFTPLTTEQSFYPALRGMSSGGLKAVDQVAITGTFSPAIPTDITLVAKLDFATVINRNYYIYTTDDLSQWKAIEGPILSTGGIITRYYPATAKSQFFRIVQE